MRNKHFTMKELPITERPYEKCEKYGTASLSDAELLAVIIRTGSNEEHSVQVAQRVLKECSDQYGCDGLIGLKHLTIKELKAVKGIGKVKAIQLLCAAELSRRMIGSTRSHGISFSTPAVVAKYYMEDMRHLEREQILLVILDAKSRKLKEMIISSGTVNASIAAPRDVFYQAMKHGAVSIILLHNHPSGDPSPSREDLLVTSRMKETGSLVGIPLTDHIILGDNQFVSFRERGLL